VAGGETTDEPDGQFWAPPAARDVSVIYAGDVGEYRIALVEGDWHWGPIADRQQVWFQAQAGAPASAMEKGGNDSPSDVVVAPFSGSFGIEPTDSAAVIAISSSPRRVVLHGPPVIDAQARVTRQTRTLTGVDGVYAAGVTAPGISVFSVEGLPDTLLSRSNQDYQPRPVTAQSPARGGVTPQDLPLDQFAAGIWGKAWQRVGSGDRFQLLAVESTARPMTDGPVRSVVGLVTLPSGARVLAGGEHRSAGGDWLEVDAARLLPAGEDLSDLSIAWRNPAGARDPGWTVAMGPVGTARIQWIHRNGSITSGGAENTIAATEHDDVASVRFLDADGGVIGAADVLDQIDASGVAVLPEVAVPR
jgi:hypothetical protein